MNPALYIVFAFALTPLAFGLLLALAARIHRGYAERERVILALLREHEDVGADLVARSGGRLSRGTVCVALASMEERGLIVSFLAARGVRSRIYRLTDKGRAMVTT